mgnify:CR=1 FL=1
MYLNRLPKLIDGRVLIIEGLLDPVSESHDRDESEHSALNGLLGTRPLESANHHPSNRCRWISQTNYEDARERRHQRMGSFGGGGGSEKSHWWWCTRVPSSSEYSQTVAAHPTRRYTWVRMKYPESRLSMNDLMKVSMAAPKGGMRWIRKYSTNRNELTATEKLSLRNSTWSGEEDELTQIR